MKIEMFFEWINTHIFGVTVPLILIVTGIYFCVRLNFFHFLHPIKWLKKMLRKESGEAEGETPLHALCMALAGTLGVGNITGIALAISIGGAGSIFWMWVSAFAAMIIRYAEIVLALYSRVSIQDGKNGCAMYYIKRAFKGKQGEITAFIFALLCLACAIFLGAIIQANVISESLFEVFGYPKAMSGALLALLTAFVIFGGRRKISSLTAKIVPFMTILYIFISIFAICSRAEFILPAFRRIFSDAFRIESACGGFVGILTSSALRTGVSKGLISNEAGCGTAPMAHATTSAKSPAKQGLFGIFEVFVDTILLCTLTALVILTSFENIPTLSGGGIMLIISSFSFVFGKNAGFLITVCIFFFAFATIICWAFYGETCFNYLSKNKSRLFLIIFCASLFYGGIAAPLFVWTITDFIISLMTVINILAIIKMADSVVALSADYGLIKINSHEYERINVRHKNKAVQSCHSIRSL